MTENLLDSDTFKSVLDVVDELLDRLNDLDFSDLLALGAVFLTLGKSAVKNFLSGAKNMTSSVSNLFSTAATAGMNKFNERVTSESGKISKLFSKITVKIGFNQNTFTKEIQQIQNKIKELNQQKVTIQANIDAAGITNQVNKLYQNILNDGKLNEFLNAEDKNNWVRENYDGQETSVIKQTEEYARNQEKINQLNEEQVEKNKKLQESTYKTQGAMQALSTSVSTVVMALMTSEDASDFLKQALTMLAIQVIPQVITTLAQVATQALTTGSTVAAAGETAGAGISTGIAMATLGISLLIEAVVLLTTYLARLGWDEWKEYQEDTRKATDAIYNAQDAVETLTDRQEDLNDELTEQNELLSEAEDNYKNLNSYLKQYQEYASKLVLTEDEESEYLDLQNEIAVEYPELIAYYDEEGNAILKGVTAWKETLVEVQKEYAEQQVETAEAAIESSTNEYAIAYNEKVIAEETQENYNKYIEAFTGITEGNIYGKDTSWVWDEGNKEYKSKGDESLYAVTIENPVTAVGVLKALNDEQESAYAEIFKQMDDEMLSEIGIKSTMESDEVIDAVIDYLQDGNDSDEQKAWNKLKESLEDVGANIQNTITECTQELAAAEEVVDESLTDYVSGQLALNDDYQSADENMQSVMQNYIIAQTDLTTEDLVNEFLKDDDNEEYRQKDDDGNDVQDENGNYVLDEGTDASLAFSDFITEQLAEELGSDKIEELLGSYFNAQTQYYIDELVTDGITQSELDTLKTYLENLGMEQQQINDVVGSYQEQFNSMYNTAVSVGFDNVKTELSSAGLEFSTEQMDAYATAVQNAIDNGVSDTEASEGIAEIVRLGIENGLDEEEISALLTIDYSEMDVSTLNDMKDELKQVFKAAEGDSFDEADYDAFWEQLVATGKNYDIIEDTVTLTSLSDLDDSIKEELDTITDSASSVSSILQEALTNGSVNYSYARDLEEQLESLDLNPYDYMSYDENSGEYLLDVEAIEEAYYDQVTDQGEILEYAKDQIEASLDELNAENAVLESLKTQIEHKRAIIELSEQEAELAYTIAGIESDPTNPDIYDAEIEALQAQYGSDSGTWDKYDGLLDSIDEQIEANNESIAELEKVFNPDTGEYDEDLLAQYVDIDAWKAAGYEIEDLWNTISENAAEDIAEAATETSEYEEKLEAVEDAEESLLEAQEKLNDALEDYNELLYGSDNRKSSLDNLYNYSEAINSYTNAATRAEDALGDATTIEEATAAWQDYAEAYHNVIAYTQAESQVIEEALDNYSDWIENATSSYVDEENGNSITINYSDYVTYDENTGKYVLDQELLNQAEFNDDYKELLETQVSNYNKYSEELLTLEDNLKEAEEKLQEAREQAYKDYASMEDEIASVLKEKYQDEVDALKEKYESMEEADSDYYDALKDAIDKQRELRDQEDEYEDLAQQERKLALMQRDTSGANQTEVMELEDEVEESRQDLLDDEVDQILDSIKDANDNLSELHDTEIELKEAILDNTAYWNSQAETIAASFTSADDYVEWMTENSTEFIESTMTKQITLMNDWTDTATNALTKYAIDGSDTIEEYVAVSTDEVADIISTTGEALTNEVTRQAGETTDQVNEDLQSAINSIDDARQSVADAEEALAEAKAALDAFNSALATTASVCFDANGADGSYDSTGNSSDSDIGSATGDEQKRIGESKAAAEEVIPELKAYVDFTGPLSTSQRESATNAMREGFSNEAIKTAYYDVTGETWTQTNGQTFESKLTSLSEGTYRNLLKALVNDDYYKYASGGLVDYTGPAWVDGTPSSPEAFLSAEDTERIGRAAEILADLPLLNSTSSTDNINSTSYGDTTIEINLNIDSLSSDVDVDNMIELMKQEIVDAANPVGSSNILTKSY